MKCRKILTDSPEIANVCLNICFLVTSACCTSIPTSFSRNASAGNIDKLAVCAHILWTFKSILKSANIWKTIKEKFAYRSVYCFYNAFALEFQCTLGDKHQQKKLPCMPCYRLAYILHCFSHEPCKFKMKYSKITPKNCENCCEYKTYFTCVSNCCLFAHQLQLVLLDKHW